MQQWLQCKRRSYLRGLALEIEAHSLNMGRHRKWSLVARNPFATIRGHSGRRRKGVEGLCVSSLLGVLRSHTWLMGGQDVGLLLGHDSPPPRQDRRAHSLSFSSFSPSADGGSEDLADPRSPGVDPQFSHFGQGKKSFKNTFCPFGTVRSIYKGEFQETDTVIGNELVATGGEPLCLLSM